MGTTSTGNHIWPTNEAPAYKINWSATEYSVEFSVFEIDAFYEDGAFDLGDQVLDGFIKWDGCANISYGDIYQHFCGVKDLQAFWQLQAELYAKAAALMTSLGSDYPEQNADLFLIGEVQK